MNRIFKAAGFGFIAAALLFLIIPMLMHLLLAVVVIGFIVRMAMKYRFRGDHNQGMAGERYSNFGGQPIAIDGYRNSTAASQFVSQQSINIR